MVRKMARDPKRIDEILAIVRLTWLEYPDQRFMQLCYNIYRTANLDPGISGDYFYTEDDDLLEYIHGLSVREEGQTQEGGPKGGDSRPAPESVPHSRKRVKRNTQAEAKA